MTADSSREPQKNKYLLKLMPIIKHRGFSHLRIDDIVRHMDISKATFYKYFSSKEEVIELMVEMGVSYIENASTQINDESSSLLQRFQNTFMQSLVIASYLSDVFLFDLKQIFPSLWEHIREAQHKRQQQLQQFYLQGIAAGVFQPINPVLVTLQDERLLQSILDPVFLMEHDLTLKALLFDYYELQKYQWLTPEPRQRLDDEPVKEYIEAMSRKISLGMRLDGVL